MKKKLMIFSLIIMTIILIAFNCNKASADTTFDIKSGTEKITGTTIDTEYTITYKITQVSKNGTAVTETSPGITLTNGTYKIGGDSGQTGTGTGFTIATSTEYPGTYDFLVQEEFATTVTDDKGTFCLDPMTYTIQAVVTATSDTPSITIQKNNTSKDKTTEISFTNAYISKVDTGVVINTTTTGTDADSELEFPYKITITYPTYSSDAATEEIEKQRQELADKLGVTPTTDGNTDTFIVYVKGGDSIDTGTLPAGTTYTVQEILEETDGVTYNDKYAEYDNGSGTGKNSQVYTGTVNTESASTVTITNTRNTATPAGVVMDNLPYIAMIAVACAGFSLIIVKKRKSARN